MRRIDTYLRTWVIVMSLIPGWYPGHEVHVDLNIWASAEISNDLPGPSKVSGIMEGKKETYLAAAASSPDQCNTSWYR
jgi:hypothetical protein